MGDVLLEFIKDFFAEFLIQDPGAFLIWLFVRKRKSFDEVVGNYPFLNGVLSFLIILGLVFVIYNLKKYNN